MGAKNAPTAFYFKGLLKMQLFFFALMNGGGQVYFFESIGREAGEMHGRTTEKTLGDDLIKVLDILEDLSFELFPLHVQTTLILLK